MPLGQRQPPSRGVGSSLRCGRRAAFPFLQNDDDWSTIVEATTITRREMEEKYPNVFWGHLPSPSQYALWHAWVSWDDGSGDDGWILGWCPLHDKEHGTVGSAEFNFNAGAMRCHGDPRCFLRRAMSLTNVALRMNNGE